MFNTAHTATQPPPDRKDSPRAELWSSSRPEDYAPGPVPASARRAGAHPSALSRGGLCGGGSGGGKSSGKGRGAGSRGGGGGGRGGSGGGEREGRGGHRRGRRRNAISHRRGARPGALGGLTVARHTCHCALATGPRKKEVWTTPVSYYILNILCIGDSAQQTSPPPGKKAPHVHVARGDGCSQQRLDKRDPHSKEPGDQPGPHQLMPLRWAALLAPSRPRHARAAQAAAACRRARHGWWWR